MLLHNKKYSVVIQGCRTNQYEGEALASALEAEGCVRDSAAPDIVIIVSCTITETADRKCRKLLRRMRHDYPDAVICLCGCYAQKTAPTAEADIIVGNRLKTKIPALIASFIEHGQKIICRDENIIHNACWDNMMLDKPRLHTRAFLKVQDGCNHYCSYCIVPQVRGLPVSRPLDETLEEAAKITESGCREIVLTGIHLGLYEKLPELVEKLCMLPGLLRLRFGSIEPMALNDDLIGVLASNKKFCRHLHIPLQSGDDGVLAAMRRGYSTEDFAGIVERSRSALGKDLHISTDMMFGFPAESEGAFLRSLDFARRMRFGKIHVFPYSPRENTIAAAMKQSSVEERERRAKEALQTADALHRDFAERYIGKECKILVEENKNGAADGLTENYLRIKAKTDAPVNSEAVVTPSSYENEMLLCADVR